MKQKQPPRVERRLAAIVAADVAGYSRLMGLDEVGTARTLREHRAVTDALVAKHGGRLVKSTGDGVLLEFPSVVDAVECAVAVQAVMAQRNEGVPLDRRMLFRMGINLGDILIEGDDILGDGVNIAARLEGIAEPGGICISSSAYDQVRGKVQVDFVEFGEQNLKNISRPIRVYAVGESMADGQTPLPISSAPHISIVVLPFANIGGDPEQEYFADGVTESLTTDLSRIVGSFVIARNSAFTFKGKAIDVKKLGRELNVRYVLEGSVQRGASRLRINVQLIDAQTGNHLWADRFDKPIADILDMQDEIVSRLANALDAQFVAAEAHRAERAPHPDAMDIYFQGLGWLYRGLAADHIVQAQRVFERGLSLYPDNVDLLVGAGVSDLALAINYVVDDRLSRLAAAEATFAKAQSIAPDHAYAHLFLGVLLNSTKRALQGIAECERALAINRNLAQAHAYIGQAKYILGRAAETETHVNEALRLSPRDPFAYHWFLFVGAGRSQLKDYAGAVAWLRRSNGSNRNFPIAYFHLASALAHLGKLTEARAAAEEGLALNPGFTIRRLSSYPLGDHPTYLDGFERVCAGLRLAGVPEE
jgi:TolB-like protein/class 3 adenylate cyclase